MAVFGSYLTDKPKLGDLDIALELGPKERCRERHWALAHARRSESPPYMSYLAALCWSETEVRRALKQRSAAFSFHSREEVTQRLKCPMRLLGQHRFAEAP